MAVLEIGPIPEYIHLNLTRDSDFAGAITYLDASNVAADWPVGTSLSFVFESGDAWAASIAGAVATWAVDKALTNARINGEVVSLVYANGTTDLVIWRGKVARHG